jgi:hypothetical protein
MAQPKRTTRISQKAARSRFPETGTDISTEDKPTEVGQAVLDALLAPTGKVHDADNAVATKPRNVRRLTPEARAKRMAGPVRTSDKVGLWECYKCRSEGKLTNGEGTAELLAHTRRTGHSEFEDVTRFRRN